MTCTSTLPTCSMNDVVFIERNIELILPSMESHARILFRHAYPNCFLVYTISEVLVPELFAVESLEAVQAEIMFVLVLTAITSE